MTEERVIVRFENEVLIFFFGQQEGEIIGICTYAKTLNPHDCLSFIKEGK